MPQSQSPLIVSHSYLWLMLYFLLLMNVLLEQMVLASWKLKDKIKYKAFCFVLLVSNRQTNPQTDTFKPTDWPTDRQTETNKQNRLNFWQIWSRVDLKEFSRNKKLIKLKLLHYVVIDTYQLVWVPMFEIEAPAVFHEHELGFPWYFWWPAQSTRQNKVPCKKFPFDHHWKRSSVTHRTSCTIYTGLPSAQDFYWAEICRWHTHLLQTDLYTNKTH